MHAPGTLLIDQFGGNWSAYFAAIAQATPRVAALGITDYFTLRGYKEFRRLRPTEAFPWVKLVFPNVELRLSLQTKDGAGVNLHLLVSPDDPSHVARIEERLATLRFDFRGSPYPCTDDGLVRLGRAHSGDPKLAEQAALTAGCNQFKVELRAVRELFDRDEWVMSNVLVAVAAGKDGLGGLSQNASFKAQREELGRFSNIVFSGFPSDRRYWLGDHPKFAADAQSPKPCLHGCDAHELASVLAPEFDRRCWIRGEASFDALRQTLVEPERRVFIGDEPPRGAQADGVLSVLKVRAAPWLKTPEIHFNDGLVTVIGAKGSGKTALADLIALATAALEAEPGPASFVAKARPLLGQLEAEVEWGDGSKQSGTPASEANPQPRVQYLSQQFVERLSAPAGLTEPLVEEIERVVFGAIPDEDRMQATTFGELREILLEGPTAARDYERGSISTLTRRIATEQALQRSLTSLKNAAAEARRAREGLEKEIASIPVKASEDKVKAHQVAAAAVQRLSEEIAKAERRALDVGEIAAEVRRHTLTADTQWQALKTRYQGVADDPTWETLRLAVDASAFTKLSELQSSARQDAAALRDRGTTQPQQPGSASPAQGLAALTAARDKLATELGLDQTKAKRRAELEKRLVTLKANEVKATADATNAEGAAGRIKDAQQSRLAAHEAVFGTLADEEAVLAKLYGPLQDRINQDTRLVKLSFVVNRVVDVDRWAAAGEALFDLRKPPLSGRGVLVAEGRSTLVEPWTRGSPSEVNAAMRAFYERYVGPSLDSLAQDVTPFDVGEWFFSSDHIRVRYGVQYEDVPIARLSPGTRGVVLLTLYLALDQWDTRPLLIDQPEENLDPSSVYDDLVPFFREAAARRQIIMVTHNANLVVNTDSDQVIVASSVRPSPTSLPDVTYSAGGLEDPTIRAEICRLLEGGELAFKRRAQRYGIDLRS